MALIGDGQNSAELPKKSEQMTKEVLRVLFTCEMKKGFNAECPRLLTARTNNFLVATSSRTERNEPMKKIQFVEITLMGFGFYSKASLAN